MRNHLHVPSGRWAGLAALAAVFAAVTAVALVGSAAAASTWTVCASGCNYTTIQAAVNAVTTLSGDTIQVGPGNYAVTGANIDKPLTLLGAQAGVDARTRSGPETVITTGGLGTFTLNATNITFDGFTFSNLTNRTLDTYFDADNFTMRNTILEGNIGTYSGGGIQFGGGLNLHANGFDFEQNLVTADNGVLLYLGHAMDNGTVRNNIFHGDTVTFGPFGNRTGWTIEGNEFNGNVPGHGPYWGYGFNANLGNAVIRNNYVHQMSVGLGQVSLVGGSVTGNTFVDNQYGAFQLWGGEYGSVVSSNVQIANNLIKYDGLACTDYTDASHGIRLRPGLDATTIHLHDNSFIDLGLGGCGQAWAIRQDGSGAADATNNWWGQSTGPAAGQNGGAVSTSPYISAYIDDPAHAGQLGFWPLLASQLNAGTTSCNGIYTGTGKDVVIPTGAVCTLVSGAHVTHDVQVQKGGTLIDQGATIDHDLSADHPAGIQVNGGTVGHDLSINGVSGAPAGGNYVRNANVAHDLTVQDSTAPIVVSGNTVGHDLKVQNNHPGGVTVSANSAGHDAVCQSNSPQGGSGNGAGHANSCPV